MDQWINATSGLHRFTAEHVDISYVCTLGARSKSDLGRSDIWVHFDVCYVYSNWHVTSKELILSFTQSILSLVMLTSAYNVPVSKLWLTSMMKVLGSCQPVTNIALCLINPFKPQDEP